MSFYHLILALYCYDTRISPLEINKVLSYLILSCAQSDKGEQPHHFASLISTIYLKIFSALKVAVPMHTSLGCRGNSRNMLKQHCVKCCCKARCVLMRGCWAGTRSYIVLYKACLVHSVNTGRCF